MLLKRRVVLNTTVGAFVMWDIFPILHGIIHIIYILCALQVVQSDWRVYRVWRGLSGVREKGVRRPADTEPRFLVRHSTDLHGASLRIPSRIFMYIVLRCEWSSKSLV